MAEPSQIEMIAKLSGRWRRWTAMVRLVASRQEKRYAVDADEYHALHCELLKCCRALASQGKGTAQPMFRELEELLSPWVNFDSLVRADREIISKLLDRCQAVQQVLDGRPARSANWRPSKLALTVVAALAVVALFWLWSADLASLPRLGAPAWFHRVMRAVSSSSSNRPVFIFGAVAVVIAMFLAWRSGRWT